MLPRSSANLVKQTLLAQSVPEAKAEVMVKSISRGIWLVVIGLFLLAAAFVFCVLLIIRLQKEPGLLTGSITVAVAALGIYFLVAGGNVMSGQALDAAAKSPIFGFAAWLIRLLKTGAAPATPPSSSDGA